MVDFEANSSFTGGETPDKYIPFRAPFQKRRFKLIEEMTDTGTAVDLFSLVFTEYANTEAALKAAVRQAMQDAAGTDDRYRYYCTECGFIGAAQPTKYKAAYGAVLHASFDESCETVVFQYDTGEWDADAVEQLAATGTIDFPDSG